MTEKTTNMTFERQEYHQNLMDKMSIQSSSADTCRPENNKDLYVKKLEKQVESLKSIIDDMTDKSRQLEKGIRDEFEEDRNIIEQRYQQVKERIGKVRETGNDAWKELAESSSKALQEFTDGIRKAADKFK